VPSTRPPHAHGGEDRFPEDVRKKLNGWHWGNHSLVTLHLALRDKPVYHSAEFDPDIDRAFNIFFGMDDIEQVLAASTIAPSANFRTC
jgi:hypothetical protein